MQLGRRQRRAGVRGLALADQQRRDVGERRQIAARADRALLRDQRHDVEVEQIDEALEQLEPDAGEAPAERGEPGREHRARRSMGEMGAEAAAVEARELQRQLLDQRARHALRAGIAVAGGDAIDHAVLVEQAVEEGRALGDPAGEGRVVGEAHRGALLRDREHVLDGQRPGAEDDRFGVGAGHGAERKRHHPIIFHAAAEAGSRPASRSRRN